MAMGRDQYRTILVELGNLRPFSDVGGLHTIRIGDSPAWRNDLAQRLELAGCDVSTTGTDWLADDYFRDALELINSVSVELTNSPEDIVRDNTQTLLSEKAKEILVSAVQGGGHIFRVDTSTLSGLDEALFTHGGRNRFGKRGDNRSFQMWKAALNELVDHEYVEDSDGKGSMFAVTHEGYRLIDRMELGK